MAAREFRGVIFNQWDSPLFHSNDDVDSGEWQDPWYPSQRPGAGEIAPQKEEEWRSESDGAWTGTSGWARWGVRVRDVFSDNADHFEYVQVNWSVPFFQTDYPNITWDTFRNNPDESDEFTKPDPRPPILEIVPAMRTNSGTLTALAQTGMIAPYILALPVSFFITGLFGPVTHPRVHFIVRQRARNQAKSSSLRQFLEGNSLPVLSSVHALVGSDFSVRRMILG